ncbi:hypothetical protein HAX54_048760, partial [Datura stramonium]|nr:hypothetical protein [Datura stramonium]
DALVQVGGINVATNYDFSDEIQAIEPHSNDYDSQELELFMKEMMKEIDEKFDVYKTLNYGMTFKDIKESKRVVTLYSVTTMKTLKLLKSDTKRVRYKFADGGFSFVCYIARDGKN